MPSDLELIIAGHAVEKRRGALGLTQGELAERAGVSVKTIYGLESGRRWPQAKNRSSIERALGWDEGSLSLIAEGDPPPALAETPRPGLPDFGDSPEARMSERAVQKALWPADVRSDPREDLDAVRRFLLDTNVFISPAEDDHLPDVMGALESAVTVAFLQRKLEQAVEDVEAAAARVEAVRRNRQVAEFGLTDAAADLDRVLDGLGAGPAAAVRAALAAVDAARTWVSVEDRMSADARHEYAAASRRVARLMAEYEKAKEALGDDPVIEVDLDPAGPRMSDPDGIRRPQRDPASSTSPQPDDRPAEPAQPATEPARKRTAIGPRRGSTGLAAIDDAARARDAAQPSGPWDN